MTIFIIRFTFFTIAITTVDLTANTTMDSQQRTSSQSSQDFADVTQQSIINININHYFLFVFCFFKLFLIAKVAKLLQQIRRHKHVMEVQKPIYLDTKNHEFFELEAKHPMSD